MEVQIYKKVVCVCSLNRMILLCPRVVLGSKFLY